MNNILQFNNKEFGELTVIEKDGEFFFLGKEVAEKLGYHNLVNIFLQLQERHWETTVYMLNKDDGMYSSP